MKNIGRAEDFSWGTKENPDSYWGKLAVKTEKDWKKIIEVLR